MRHLFVVSMPKALHTE